jgi:type I restriction enzyme R subunit
MSKLLPELHLGTYSGTYSGTYDQSAEPATEAELRQAVAQHLQADVAAMNLDSFLVRPQRQLVETYAQSIAWEEISAEQAAELATHVAGLPTQLAAEAEEAKRFDLLLLRLELGQLRAEPGYLHLVQQVQSLAAALETQDGIPVVREQMALIQEIQTAEWWENITLPLLERGC